jgi:hypothetical protein
MERWSSKNLGSSGLRILVPQLANGPPWAATPSVLKWCSGLGHRSGGLLTRRGGGRKGPTLCGTTCKLRASQAFSARSGAFLGAHRSSRGTG